MKKYIDLFNEVKRIICTHDPIGLISGGSPDDEYDHEVAKICSLAPKATSLDNLHFKISDVFRVSFGDDEITNSRTKQSLELINREIFDLVN